MLLEILIIQKYEKMMEKVVMLSRLTPYHNFNLELFLPNVKKGLITGRSNSIWHGLYNKLPVYNCVSDETKSVSVEKMHSYNMSYFNVDSCEGGLSFDKEKYDIIDNTTRKSDFVKFLDLELHGN